MPGFELIGAEERAAVNELFDDGGVLFAHGFDAMRNGRYRVREFEQRFADFLGVRYAQAVSSGTAALKTALVALGVKPGDEVITQAFTFIATVEAILDVGAKPVIVNVNDTLNMDPNELEGAITEKTKAIVPVHMLGVAAEQDQILALARRRQIPVLDDNCESLGATWNGEKLGAQADVCAWSFDAGKTVIAGEGGMVTTNDEELYRLAREFHDHGHMYNLALPRGRDTHRIYGFNFRMTELQAAVGMAQFRKLDYIVSQNRANYALLEEGLKGIDGVGFRRIPEPCEPLCDTLIIYLPDRRCADDLVARLSAQGIGTKNVPDAIEWHFAKYWDHMLDRFEMNQEQLNERLRPSAEIIERSVALPIMVKTTTEETEKRVETVRAALAESGLH